MSQWEKGKINEKERKEKRRKGTHYIFSSPAPIKNHLRSQYEINIPYIR